MSIFSFPRHETNAALYEDTKPEEAVLPDPSDWRDSQYYAAVRGRMMASHFCTFSTTAALMVAMYAASKGVWPIAGLMTTGVAVGSIFAFGFASRAYHWQKHDRIMRHEAEANETIALQENGRLWRENNVHFLARLDEATGGRSASAEEMSLLEDDAGFSSADVVFLQPKRTH